VKVTKPPCWAQPADYAYIHDKWKCINSVSASQEATISEIVLDDDISDGIKYKLDIVGVCCNGELRVDVLRVPATIQSLKLLLDVTARLLVRTSTCLHNGTVSVL